MDALLNRFGSIPLGRVKEKGKASRKCSNKGTATRECCLISGNAAATHTTKMTVLLGTLQDSCPLSVLKGHAELLRKIFSDVDDMSKTHIKRGEVAYKVCAAAAVHERSCLSVLLLSTNPCVAALYYLHTVHRRCIRSQRRSCGSHHLKGCAST
jgi:hypothetical protein